MALDDALHGREPHAVPGEFGGGVQAVEGAEEAVDPGHVEAGTVVADDERAAALVSPAANSTTGGSCGR